MVSFFTSYTFSYPPFPPSHAPTTIPLLALITGACEAIIGALFAGVKTHKLKTH